MFDKKRFSISLKADWGSSDFAMDYRPIMGGEERRQYIYDGLVAGQIKKGKSCLLYTSMGAGPWLGPFFTTHMCSTSCE